MLFANTLFDTIASELDCYEYIVFYTCFVRICAHFITDKRALCSGFAVGLSSPIGGNARPNTKQQTPAKYIALLYSTLTLIKFTIKLRKHLLSLSKQKSVFCIPSARTQWMQTTIRFPFGFERSKRDVFIRLIFNKRIAFRSNGLYINKVSMNAQHM